MHLICGLKRLGFGLGTRGLIGTWIRLDWGRVWWGIGEVRALDTLRSVPRFVGTCAQSGYQEKDDRET